LTIKIVRFIKYIRLGETTMGEILPTKTSSQPLSYRIYDYLREAIIKNEFKSRNIFLEKDIYDRLERNENMKEK
jgi:hypothetical protein